MLVNLELRLVMTEFITKSYMLMLQKEFKLCYNSFNRSSLATYLKARRLNGV